MDIVTSEDRGTTACVALKGRLDIVGAVILATPLATLAGAKQGLIIDIDAA